MATIKSIEEKAKAYDEAIKVAQRFYNNSVAITKKGLEDIFPELKESDDERMIQYFKDLAPFDKADELYEKYGFSHKDAISWLEKQGEQNSIDDLTQQEAMDIAVAKCFEQGEQKPVVIPKFRIGDIIKDTEDGEVFTIRTITKDKYIYTDDSFDWIKDQDEYELVEQKPADKVEPKFKIEKEKWYVCTQTYVLRGKIVVIKGQTYQAEKDNVIKGEDGCLFIDKHDGKASDYFRYWAIQDAKDGDVLATDDGNIFVFDGTVEEDKYPFAYYGLTRRRFESYDRRLPFTHNNVHPATKEQREQLEKAMANAGYTFDFEKKELRKIEQKFAEWDEEDENRFNNLIFLVECSDENEPTKKGFIDFINRLKSTSHQKYGSRVMSREDLLNKLEEIQTEYKRRMHDAQAKEDYIYASGLCGAISRVIKIVKED